MYESPIDACSTTLGHLCLTKTNVLLDQTNRQHLEGGNHLQTDVVGCLTPFPTHNQIPESISSSRPGFQHVLIQLIKTNQTYVTNDTFNFLMVGGNSKSRVFFSPLPYLRICRSTHTYMHVFLQYVHIPHTINNEIPSILMKVGRIIVTIFWHQ